jgi:hypothetical protein
MSRLYFLVQKIGPPSQVVLRWIAKVPVVLLLFIMTAMIGVVGGLLRWAFGSG